MLLTLYHKNDAHARVLATFFAQNIFYKKVKKDLTRKQKYDIMVVPFLKGDFMEKFEKQKILQLYKEGKSYKWISMDTGIPSSTIASFLRREHGYVLRSSRKSLELKRNKLAAELSKQINLPQDTCHAIIAETYQKYINKQAFARKNGHDFDFDFFKLKFPTHCPLLNIKLDYFAKGPVHNNISFDRINNKLGYIDGNVQIASLRGNKLKNDSTGQELLTLAMNLLNIEQTLE